MLERIAVVQSVRNTGGLPTPQFTFWQNFKVKRSNSVKFYGFVVVIFCRVSISTESVGSAVPVCAGIGGSGRQSATKLAAYMCPSTLFQIEITRNYTAVEWRDDIKKVLSRGKSGPPALGGTEYRLMPSACRLIVRAKL